jgi:hypothetical protein
MAVLPVSPPHVIHRRTLRDHPTPTPQPTLCRLWQGATRRGYGVHHRQSVHRWVWEQINGPIPEGMFVLHRCDQRLCYRLDHLFLGTAADNTADMVSKGRWAGLESRRGAEHHSARLTASDVRAIRATPDMSIREWAAILGVAEETVRKARVGLTWKDAGP